MRVHSVHPLDSFTVALPGLEVVGDVDATDDENTVVLTHLTPNVGTEFTLTCTDPARLQRASEGSRQSATC